MILTILYTVVLSIASIALGRWLGHKTKSQEVQRPNNTFVECMIEVIPKQGIFYAYIADGGRFLAQGRDMMELAMTLELRYPYTIFAVSNDNAKQIGILQ